jgi:hypothetical protein
MAILLSAGYASLYHLWGGRSLRELGICFVVAAVGFLLGQAVGSLTTVSLLQMGQLHVVEASVGAWLALIGMRLLTDYPKVP